MEYLSKAARLSPCGKYRYTLERTWDPSRPLVTWIAYNPSTADAELDDPTVRRIRDFSRRFGHGGFVLVNLFAWRATDPRELRDAEDPVGPDNDDVIRLAALMGPVVCAWGANPARGRDRKVLDLIGRAHCLNVTRAGAPAHPLYQPRTARLKPYPPA